MSLTFSIGPPRSRVVVERRKFEFTGVESALPRGFYTQTLCLVWGTGIIQNDLAALLPLGLARPRVPALRRLSPSTEFTNAPISAAVAAGPGLGDFVYRPDGLPASRFRDHFDGDLGGRHASSNHRPRSPVNPRSTPQPLGDDSGFCILTEGASRFGPKNLIYH